MKRALSVLVFLSGCCQGDALCLTKLDIHFSRPVSFPYQVEVLSLQGEDLGSGGCAQPTAVCNAAAASVYAVREGPIVVRVTEGTLVSVDTVAVEYNAATSNGCQECRSGETTMQLGNTR